MVSIVGFGFSANAQTIQELFDKGNAAYSKGDYDKAIEFYQKIIDIKPIANVYCNMGAAYKDGKKNYNRAIECYKKAIELQPNFPEAYFNMASAYKSLENYNKAIECCKKAIQLGYEPAKKLLEDLEMLEMYDAFQEIMQ